MSASRWWAWVAGGAVAGAVLFVAVVYAMTAAGMKHRNGRPMRLTDPWLIPFVAAGGAAWGGRTTRWYLNRGTT